MAKDKVKELKDWFKGFDKPTKEKIRKKLEEETEKDRISNFVYDIPSDSIRFSTTISEPTYYFKSTGEFVTVNNTVPSSWFDPAPLPDDDVEDVIFED